MHDLRRSAPSIWKRPVPQHKDQPGNSPCKSCEQKNALPSSGSGEIHRVLFARVPVRKHIATIQLLRNSSPRAVEFCTENLHKFFLEAGQAELRLLPGANAVTLSQGMRRLSLPNKFLYAPLRDDLSSHTRKRFSTLSRGKKAAHLGLNSLPSPCSLEVTALPKQDVHMGTIPCIISSSDFSRLEKSRIKLPNTSGDLRATLSPFTSWRLGHAEP